MSGEIRIAHVAPQLETGGLERLLAGFARHADRRRFALRFVALGTRGCVAEDIESHGWSVTALGAGPGVRPSVVRDLARMFRQERIGIVHTHNSRALIYAGPAAKLAGACVVHTRHGQRHGASRRQDVLFRLAGFCADRLVCVSEDGQRLCRREGFDGGSLCTIWNGIERDRFSFVGPAADGPALFVGRLSPEKDVATLLKAVAIVIRERPSFRLRIAGAGPCHSKLVAMSESLQVHEHVDFMGEVRDVSGLLRTSSMLVLPSLTEGLPLTVLEAMACGLPVVATRVGGTPEAVEHGTSGLLVPPREPARLADAMLQVSADPEKSRQMGLAGHRRVAAHFDVGTMVSRYESLYRSVHSGGGAAERVAA